MCVHMVYYEALSAVDELLGHPDSGGALDVVVLGRA